MAPRIREATEDDLPALVALLDQLSLDGSQEDSRPLLAGAYREAFRRIQTDANQQLLVLEIEGRIAGSLVLIIVPNLTHQGKPYVSAENVVVDEKARGQGHGERLMRYAIDEAKAAGCYKIQLTSHRSRADAHRFYERLGFRSTHEAYRITLED